MGKLSCPALSVHESLLPFFPCFKFQVNEEITLTLLSSIANLTIHPVEKFSRQVERKAFLC